MMVYEVTHLFLESPDLNKPWNLCDASFVSQFDNVGLVPLVGVDMHQLVRSYCVAHAIANLVFDMLSKYHLPEETSPLKLAVIVGLTPDAPPVHPSTNRWSIKGFNVDRETTIVLRCNTWQYVHCWTIEVRNKPTRVGTGNSYSTCNVHGSEFTFVKI